jgi:hypothetical protein
MRRLAFVVARQPTDSSAHGPDASSARRGEARCHPLRRHATFPRRAVAERRYRHPAPVLCTLRQLSRGPRLHRAELRLSRHRRLGEAHCRDHRSVGLDRSSLDAGSSRGALSRCAARHRRPFVRRPGAGARRQHRVGARRRADHEPERPLAALAGRPAAPAHAGPVVAADSRTHRADRPLPRGVDRHRQPAGQHRTQLGALGPLAPLRLRFPGQAVPTAQRAGHLPDPLAELHRRSDRALRGGRGVATLLSRRCGRAPASRAG